MLASQNSNRSSSSLNIAPNRAVLRMRAHTTRAAARATARSRRRVADRRLRRGCGLRRRQVNESIGEQRTRVSIHFSRDYSRSPVDPRESSVFENLRVSFIIGRDSGSVPANALGYYRPLADLRPTQGDVSARSPVARVACSSSVSTTAADSRGPCPRPARSPRATLRPEATYVSVCSIFILPFIESTSG